MNNSSHPVVIIPFGSWVSFILFCQPSGFQCTWLISVCRQFITSSGDRNCPLKNCLLTSSFNPHLLNKVACSLSLCLYRHSKFLCAESRTEKLLQEGFCSNLPVKLHGSTIRRRQTRRLKYAVSVKLHATAEEDLRTSGWNLFLFQVSNPFFTTSIHKA